MCVCVCVCINLRHDITIFSLTTNHYITNVRKRMTRITTNIPEIMNDKKAINGFV